MNNIKDLTQNLLDLGVNKGDTLLVRADLKSIGKIEGKNRQDYIQFLLDAVGKEGTIVGLSFTQGSFITKDREYVFDGRNKAVTGAFANTMLKHPNAKRSLHPTNSYVAIGKKAEYILEGHDENSGAYEPIRKIIELNGKMVLIGCVQSSPGFTTTHLAEIDLGLHKRIIFPKLNTVYYKTSGEKIKLFKRTDVGGCSSTFYKLYSFYILSEGLKIGYVGNAFSILMDAKLAYDIDYKILHKDPKFIICDNPYCLSCRARRWDNLKDMPIFIFRKLYQILKRKISKL